MSTSDLDVKGIWLLREKRRGGYTWQLFSQHFRVWGNSFLGCNQLHRNFYLSKKHDSVGWNMCHLKPTDIFIDITKYGKCKNSDTEFRPRTSMHKISVVIPNLMFRVLVPMPVWSNLGFASSCCVSCLARLRGFAILSGKMYPDKWLPFSSASRAGEP